MAEPNPADILKLPGQWCIGPTDLTADYPHGGTAFGVTRSASWRYGFKTKDVTAEEFGGHEVERTFLTQAAVLTAVLRSYDQAALSTLFPGVATGSVQQKPVWDFAVDDSFRAGSKMSSRAVKLCFSPLAIETHPFLILYRAIPMPEEQAAMQLNIRGEWGVGMAFIGLPDASFRVYGTGFRRDLSV